MGARDLRVFPVNGSHGQCLSKVLRKVCGVCFRQTGGRTAPICLVGRKYFAGDLGGRTGTPEPFSCVVIKLTGTRTWKVRQRSNIISTREIETGDT